MKKKIIPFILAIATLSIFQQASASSLDRLCQEARGSVYNDFTIDNYYHAETDGKIYAYIKNGEGTTYKFSTMKVLGAEIPEPIDAKDPQAVMAAMHAALARRDGQRFNRQVLMMEATARQAFSNENTVSLCINTTSEITSDDIYTAQMIQVSNN